MQPIDCCLATTAGRICNTDRKAAIGIRQARIGNRDMAGFTARADLQDMRENISDYPLDAGNGDDLEHLRLGAGRV